MLKTFLGHFGRFSKEIPQILIKFANIITITMNTVTYNGLTFKPYITYETIQRRIAEIGERIGREYAGKRPLMLCVLTGAFPFAADLFRELTIDAEIAFIRLKSYQGTATTGAVKQVLGLTEEIEGRHIIIVEDIVDTGHTMSNLISQLRERNPASVSVATLLFKPQSECCGVVPDYVGFEIPTKFIIGFGLDLDGLARNLRDIYVICEPASGDSTQLQNE